MPPLAFLLAAPLRYALAIVVLGALFAADRRLRGDRRYAFRCAVGVAAFVAVLAAAHWRTFEGLVAVYLANGAIAAAAVACVLYDRRRTRSGRPVKTRWRRRVGVALGAAAVAAYFAGAVYSFRGLVHLWDQYHYFVGGKYFPELGYDGLYRCAAVAQDELGAELYDTPDGPRVADLRAEVRAPGHRIRNLGRDNHLVPATEALAHPEACRDRFTPARWAAFRADVRFFRLTAGPAAWAEMNRDHGYNPPPLWTLVGGGIASLRPASLGWLQALAALDVALVLGCFAALAWAFGWRVAAVGAVFWGSQAYSTFFWTGGAYLRHDWLFLLVLSACLARKRRFGAAGASLAVASLLRVFPLLMAAGWAVQAVSQLVRTGTLAPSHRRLLAGGLLAAAVLVPLSAVYAGGDAYPAFARHIRLHNGTPLTNHVGLPALLSQGVGVGPESGRAKYVRDLDAPDPFGEWKRMRLERAGRARPVFWLVVAATLGWFAGVVWRIRRAWIAESLSPLWIAVLLQLTTYYYAFLLLAAPLTRARRSLELPLLSLAALSQLAWATFWWNDDRYAALSVLALAFCYAAVAAFARGRRRARERVRLRATPAVGAVAAART
ncbi:MAG TPA: hypothetical protein VHG91_02780 [Longimicrobium sp.]|nr:hypothetical protein [Longimicrobium sp.]